MANSLLPDVPVTTAQVPRTAISKSDIAAPYRDMAEAMDKSGAALTSVATDLAEQAGEKAGRNSVRTADDGSLVVDDTRNPFIVGPAAKAYERAAKLTQAAQIQPQIETGLLKLRLDHTNDPAGFAAAAKTYGDTILNGNAEKGTPGIQDPHIRGAVSDFINTNIQHNLRSSLIETNTHNTAEALQTYQARIKNLTEEMTSLARQGAGTAPVDSDAYKTFQGKAHDLATFYREMQNDPRIKMSKERADLEIAEAYSGFKVQDVIGKVQRQFFQDHDYAKATQSLINAFQGPGSENLNLTQTKRDHAVSEGLAHLRNLATTDHLAIQDNGSAVNAFLGDARLRPNQLDETQFNNFLQRSRDIGDKKSEQALLAFKDFQSVYQSESRMSPVQRAAALDQLHRGIYPTAPDAKSMAALGAQSGEFFTGRGGRFTGTNPEFAGRLRTAVEDYEKQHPGEEVRFNSLFRTFSEQQAAYRRYISGEGGLAARPGTSRHEIGEAADIPRGAFLDWLHRNAPAYGLEFLRGQAFYKDPVHVQLANSGRPGSTVNLAENDAYGKELEAAVKLFGTRVGKDAEKETRDVLDRISKGQSFGPNQLENLGAMIGASGREDLYEQLKGPLASQGILKLMPPGTTPSAFNDAMQQTIAAGVSTDTRSALMHADDRLRKDYEEMHKDPLGWGPRAEWFGPAASIDPQQPGTWMSNFKDRDTKVSAAQAWIPDLGPTSALRPDEAAQVGTMLTKGDSKVAGALLTSMQAGLSNETWRATMESGPIKDAMMTMFSSNDPNRIDAAGQSLYKLWGNNPTDFAGKYGEHALERLMGWKGLEGFTPEERAAKMQLADDPDRLKAREKTKTDVDNELKSWTPKNVADAMGNFLQRNVPFVHGPMPRDFTFGDENVGNQLLVDFQDAVKNLRVYYGLDKSAAQQKAIEQISSQWTPSQMMGGRLMKYAPEAQPGYPAIDGNHDWMMRELDREVSAIYGPKLDTFSPAGEGFPLPTGWRLRGIVADTRTEAEIKRGDRPSYQIHIIDAKGQDQLVPGRMQWDHKAALAERAAAGAQQGEAARVIPPGITGPM